MLYRPCNVPLPPDISIPEPVSPSDTKKPLDWTLPTAPQLPRVSAAPKPGKSHTPKIIEPYSLEQQNENLRTLLEQTNFRIIAARIILKQLTSDLVVNNRAGIKQNLLELNRVLNGKQLLLDHENVITES